MSFLGTISSLGMPQSKKLFSRSNIESEYHAMASVTATLLVLFCDNLSAISLAKNLVLHSRTKHIELD